MTKQIDVSIIIVHFKVRQSLIDCLESIYRNTKGISFEIIVVDNDEKKNIKKVLDRKFPNVIYVPNGNRGFAQGNNVGARYTNGKYLFFLNPDTLVQKNSIDKLYEFLEKHEKVGIVSPLLVDEQLKPFSTQSRKELTIKNAIYSYSFLRKILPNKSIYNDPFFKKWDKKQAIEVETIPGAALMVSEKLFNRIKGFDANFFLYFEENDISKRIKNLGHKLYIYPKSKVIHHVGQSTKNLKNTEKIFRESRFHYFKKHFGFAQAILTECILRISKYSLLVTAIITIGLFLRLFRINEAMIFIGDQGWFYLSARDIFLSGKIPLVGITSSHTWIHQGPLWTYLLAPILFLSGYNPVSGAYLSAIIDIGSIVLLYKIGCNFFSKRIGILSSLIYATSPLVIMNSRMPYHTSPIPFFVLLLMLSILSWIRGKRIFFPIVLLIMSVLYNFELATVVFWPVIITLLLFGYFKKREFVLKLINKKFFFISIAALLAPMIPVILYDFYHGFGQTLKFAAWFVYKGLQFFGLFPSNVEYSYYFIVNFFMESYSKLIFFPNILVSSLFLVFSICAVLWRITRSKNKSPLLIIFSISVIGLLGFFLSRTPSDAYLPMLFPLLIIIFAFSIDQFYPKFKHILFIVLCFIIFSNIYTFLNNFILVGSDFGSDLRIRIEVSDKILKLAKGDKYNLRTLGPGSEFESSTMNYEYLTWWIGKNPPTKTKSSTKIVVNENNRTVEYDK